jgi:hypothetical protein
MSSKDKNRISHVICVWIWTNVVAGWLPSQSRCPGTSRRGEEAEGHERLGPSYPGGVENMLVWWRPASTDLCTVGSPVAPTRSSTRLAARCSMRAGGAARPRIHLAGFLRHAPALATATATLATSHEQPAARARARAVPHELLITRPRLRVVPSLTWSCELLVIRLLVRIIWSLSAHVLRQCQSSGRREGTCPQPQLLKYPL